MSDSIIVTTANLVSVIVSETQGPPGLGVPAGGTVGQVLAKIDAADFNTQWVAAAAGIGSGDVIGPASAVADNFASFNATTGKLIKDSGSKASDFAAAAHNHSGVYAPVLGVDDNYVTAAEKVKLTALSGTNSGDNAVNSTYANDYRAANFSAGTHYLAPNGSAAALTAFPTLNQNTTGNAATATNLTGLTTTVATLNNQSGTNTGDNAVNSLYAGLVTNATHTGDVTGATALTIAAGAVTLAKQANMATASLVYRKTAGAGAPEVQTLATLKTDLGLTGTNSGDQDLSGLAVKANNLSDLTNATTARTNLGLGTLATQNGTFSGTSSGTNTGDQTLSDATISLTDITTNNFSITRHGFVPKGTNTGAFLKDDGTWGTPAGGGSALAILDEGVSKTAACTSIDFTGAGITATNTGGAVTVTVAGGGGSGDALVANPLSQFAATTSAQLAGVISDETGFSTGAKAVFSINPAFATSITVDGYINITGTNFGTYTTPAGSAVPSKIGIPSLAIAAFGQVVAFGLNSGSASSSRALSLFDQRAGAHQPTLAVFGVDENDLCGFSWEGTSNFCSIKSEGASMGFNIAGTNLSSFSTTEAIIKTKLSVATSASPTARLHIAAGSASANTAPLKLTSGPLLTTAEAGAIEFLTDAFYATITTGAARHKMITAPTTPTAVTGSRGGNAALASLLTALAGLGIITDSSTA
jgi:hypothetical protein